MADRTPYWFPAKRYGWGWGLPATWQGWIVFIAFLVSEISIAVAVLPKNPPLFALSTLLLVSGFVAICYLKGEPPAWRWGDRDR